MLCFGLIVMCGVTSLIHGQQTPAPPRPQTAAPPVFEQDCKDKLDRCAAFDASSCREPYLEWAKENCRQRCGFCVGPSTAAPLCIDAKKNCADYTQDVCSKTEYRAWVFENCRAYCKLCTPDPNLTTPTTTLSPLECYDRVDCRTFDKSSCSEKYKGWAMDNCPLYCGYCTLSNSLDPDETPSYSAPHPDQAVCIWYCSSTPTAPKVCEDRIPNCKAYNPNMCTEPNYQIWVQDNCRKFCGKC